MRDFNGKPHILEQALPVDYAFLKAYRADRLGNVEMRGSSRNFVPSLRQGRARAPSSRSTRSSRSARFRPNASACRASWSVACRQEDRRARPGRAWRRAAPPTSRASTTANPAGRGSEMARRTAALLDGGQLRQSRHGHSDAGLELHRGPRHHPARRKRHPGLRPAWSRATAIDHDMFNASGQFVSALPGASFFDSVTSFEMARGGKLARRRAGRLPGGPGRQPGQLQPGRCRAWAASAGRWTWSPASRR